MNSDKLGLDDESIVEEIKEVYGDKFQEIHSEDLDNLITTIRNKRFCEYEIQLDKMQEEYRKQSKSAFIFGCVFMSLSLIMIVFNIFFSLGTISMPIVTFITLDSIMGIFIAVFLIYYITFFKRFKKYFYEQLKNNNK